MTGYLTKLKEEMEARLGCGIEVVEDRDLGCSCKFEFARNYARKHHVLRFNPARCVNDYPVFYSLLNAKLQLQELDDGSLAVLQPASSVQESDRFNADFKADAKGRRIVASLGTQADAMVVSLRAAMITQACGQVLEMLAADVVLREYPEAVEDMKAYLAVSAVGGAAVPHEELLNTYPAFLVKTNRLLNLMFAMRCGEICGKRLIDAYKPTGAEIDAALDLYNFYRAERDSLRTEGRIVGDVLKNILCKLKVARYAHLVLNPISPQPEEEQDDSGSGLTDEQEALLNKFRENFGDGKPDAEVMTVAMYMALRAVGRMPLEGVRAIAVEIALLGENGIDPRKKYTLKTLPNRPDMIGLEVLAYFYVTWAKVFPDRIDSIGLPYKQSYENALAMYESHRGK